MKLTYTILFVADMSRSVAFYRSLGLALKMETPFWSEFDTGATTLALHQAAPGTSPLTPVEEGHIPAGHAHTAFAVEDLDAFAQRMRDANVPLLREVRTEDFGGRMGVWRDPDGIPVSVTSSN
jgi:catechol 2,3-dioxygenase-like lactoylglutathione lyase family enzyme